MLQASSRYLSFLTMSRLCLDEIRTGIVFLNKTSRWHLYENVSTALYYTFLKWNIGGFSLVLPLGVIIVTTRLTIKYNACKILNDRGRAFNISKHNSCKSFRVLVAGSLWVRSYQVYSNPKVIFYWLPSRTKSARLVRYELTTNYIYVGIYCK